MSPLLAPCETKNLTAAVLQLRTEYERKKEEAEKRREDASSRCSDHHYRPGGREAYGALVNKRHGKEEWRYGATLPEPPKKLTVQQIGTPLRKCRKRRYKFTAPSILTAE